MLQQSKSDVGNKQKKYKASTNVTSDDSQTLLPLPRIATVETKQHMEIKQRVVDSSLPPE